MTRKPMRLPIRRDSVLIRHKHQIF